MKKPSISTTVDEESTSPPTPYSSKSRRPFPSAISDDYFELTFYHNWLYKTIGIGYIIECAYDTEQQSLLFDKLNSMEISLMRCRNIPNNYKENYDQRRLIERLTRAVEFVKEQLSDPKENKYQVEELLNFINDQPTIAFAVTILIRSIALFQAEELLNQRAVDFLGNQLDVLSDYSVNPEFKVIEVLSKVFNYSIKVSNKTFKDVSRIVCRSKPSALLEVEKLSHRVFISITLNKKPTLKKSHKSTHQIPKSLDKDLRLPIQQHKPHPLTHPQVPIKQHQKQKQREKGYESVNVSKQLPTDRVKICLSCGQQRKPDQKFCECKKRKFTTTKAIL